MPRTDQLSAELNGRRAWPPANAPPERPLIVRLEVIIRNGDGERGALATTGYNDRCARITLDAAAVDLDRVASVDQDCRDVTASKVRCSDSEVR